MNIAAPVPGRSFNTLCVGGDGVDLRSVMIAWSCYEASGDGLYDLQKFEDQTLAGAMYHFLLWDQDDQMLAAWGLELMIDRDGPYTSFLYFLKLFDHVPLSTLAPEIIAQCYHFTKLYGARRLLLKGRDGWQRLLPRLGIKIDPDGWITEDQEFFDGIQWRQY